MSREVTLPSGAVLKIEAAPFADSKALLNAIMAEFKDVDVQGNNFENVFKQLACIGFSSPAIERCIWKCLVTCLYVAADGTDAGNPAKVTAATFEPIERRKDWVAVVMEVAQDNIGPFMSSLYALYVQAAVARAGSQTSQQPTTT